MNRPSTSAAVDKSGQRVRKMFAQIAPRYDLMNHLLSLGIDIRWRKRVVRELRLDQDRPILDCCTGTGDLALMLADKVRGRVDVIGTDFCLEMLAVAERKRLARKDKRPVRFMEADSQKLPFPENNFQAVTVAFGLRNVQDTDLGIQEMYRVCAPGGQVAILEFSTPSLVGFKQLYQFYFKHILPRVGQQMAKNNHAAYQYLPESVLEFPSGRQLADRLEACGLRQVCFWPLTFGIATLYIGNKPQ
ncbi:MAG: bifunctional demethylmenaquinone methyltransferase/2-methoxy-6-polyprenyl-1,4-benzoquinol methylase UbiE [Pirellulaceae bacterium]|nr:bifunctional demethylmenaquinone methyltransferase/2-methoxy-6-polyprenyl-1,4-benzoquinol methylase UbiE [Pirellulaceae bacterium]